METCPKKGIQGSEGNEWTITKQQTMGDDQKEKERRTASRHYTATVCHGAVEYT
jgi:hypothetical protein